MITKAKHMIRDCSVEMPLGCEPLTQSKCRFAQHVHSVEHHNVLLNMVLG